MLIFCVHSEFVKQPRQSEFIKMALLLEGVCLVAGFRVLLGSAIEEVTSTPGGPFLGLTVDSPAHSPQHPDPSSLTRADPGLTQ